MIRRKVLEEIQLEPVWGNLKHNIKRAEIVFTSKSSDKVPIQKILDYLGDEQQDFFLGCDVQVEDEVKYGDKE